MKKILKKLDIKRKQPTLTEVVGCGIVVAVVMLWAVPQIESEFKARRELKAQEQQTILEEEEKFTDSLKNVLKENEMMKSEFEMTRLDLFYKYAGMYNVEWELVYAIALHETGNFTSSAYKNLNNVGGNMGSKGLIKFDSLEKGIEYMTRNLSHNYIDKGYTTISKIQKKYAPIGATNDPQNVNSNWTRKVTQFYNELKEGK